MSFLMSALALMLQSASPGDCVYEAVTPDVRASIGDAIIARRPRSAADIDVLKGASKETLEKFIMMVKLLAVGEVERNAI